MKVFGLCGLPTCRSLRAQLQDKEIKIIPTSLGRESFRPQEQASVYMLSKGRCHQLACKAEVKLLPCFSLACETAVLRPDDQQATYYAQTRS